MSVVTKFDGHTFGSDYAVVVLGGDSKAIPPMQAIMVGRTGRWPLVGGLARPERILSLGIAIEGTSEDTLRQQLFQWFDPEDETPKTLTITDDDGSSNPRTVECICIGLHPQMGGGARIPRLYYADMMVHGDVRWRESTSSTDSWSITGTGQTKAVTNSGEADAYPILSIQPTSAKGGGYAYRRWVAVRWRASEPASRYPYELSDGGLDTASLVSGGKAQSDGDDFRVVVWGSEVDRWFGTGSNAFNQASTKIWVNLDFEADISLTLKTAIAGSGAVSAIEVNESIQDMPGAGLLLIDSEAFYYTSKNNTDKSFTGVNRALKGTSMAAHTASTAVYWIQHDIWYAYGNGSATAPDVDDDYQPAFLLTSSNTSWDYDNFGADSEDVSNASLQAGAWGQYYSGSHFGNECYTANRGTEASPWSDIGVEVYDDQDMGQWYVTNPCGITNANFQNGEKYTYDIDASVDTWYGQIRSIGPWSPSVLEASIAEPSVADTWESWSQNEALTSGATGVLLRLWAVRTTVRWQAYLEVSDVTLTLDSSYTPTTALTTAEAGGYDLDCIITNNTTGDAIAVAFLMDLNQELEVDTDAKTVTYLLDNSSQRQALTVVDGPRQDWLKLQPGSNTLQFDDTGTAAVTIGLEWYERYYH